VRYNPVRLANETQEPQRHVPSISIPCAAPTRAAHHLAYLSLGPYPSLGFLAASPVLA